jgi:hypothetical protein
MGRHLESESERQGNIVSLQSYMGKPAKPEVGNGEGRMPQSYFRSDIDKQPHDNEQTERLVFAYWLIEEAARGSARRCQGQDVRNLMQIASSIENEIQRIRDRRLSAVGNEPFGGPEATG